MKAEYTKPEVASLGNASEETKGGFETNRDATDAPDNTAFS